MPHASSPNPKPQTPNPLPTRPLLLVLVASAVLVWLYGALDPVVFAESGVKYYGPMAEASPGLALEVAQPYVFRWLGPWLAGLLPLSVPAAFSVWAWVGSLALVVLMWAVCRADGRGDRAAALAAVLLAMNPYLFGFNVFNMYQLGDLIAQVGLGAGLLLLWRRQYLALGAVMAVTVLAREPAILMVPVAAVWSWEQRRLREDGLRLVLALVPLLILFAAPRLLMAEQEGPHLVQTFINASGKALEVGTWARLLVNAWVPVVALLLVWPREAMSWARGHLHLIVLIVLTLASAFFGGDQERLMQPAIWVIYPLVALVLERHWSRQRLATGALVTAGLLAHLHHITARFPLPSRRLTAVLAAVALVLALAAALAVRLRQTPTPS
ncbi:hypothetical protein [Rubrivirga sp.]|uniref:hypothetical protein n=1 Tax=Rubrivirga sp. TaxID=1885344 RepID=UPI003C72B5AB